MRTTRSAQSGFTLLEIIVVLAVLGALAAVLTPVVFRYIDDANVTRAKSDAAGIASAINKMYKDTGRWPFYEDGDDNLAYTDGTDAAVLTSNATCVAAVCTDATLPEDETASDTWGLGGVLDGIVNHLVLNTPLGSAAAGKKYASTGSRAWKGPYVDQIPTVDPWGRSYLVNVANADPTVAEASQKWVIVISAGPDGNLNTSSAAALASNAVPTGDDIIARVR